MGNILVVEDKPQISRILERALEIEGDQLITVLNGEDAVQYALRKTPHLIILDMMLTGMDGYEVIRRFRSHPRSMYIPIIVVSANDETRGKVRAFKMGVDDYITKPFHPEELLERVRTQLRHVQQVFLSRLMDLPGAFQVELMIKCKLSSQEPWSILYLDLDNFKAFNDVYGFLAGNDMLRLVGQICRHTVCEYGNSDDFVGHIGGDDFIVLTTPDRAKSLSARIMTAYKEKSRMFYRQEDLKRGSISGLDRKGRPYQFPLVSLSIGVVNNQLHWPHSIEEISYLAAEAKRHAKQSSDNIYYISARRDGSQEYSPAASFSPSYPLGSALPFSPVDFGHRELLPIVREDAMVEYERRAH
ncbi:MAG: response regulator [Chloroflexota bacterium]|nr:response regulator [Chloroflexota bacterium]